jgi:hypothetical protein
MTLFQAFPKFISNAAVQLALVLALILLATWHYPNLGPRLDNSKIDYAELTKDGSEIPITFDFYEVYPRHFNQFHHPWYGVDSYRIEFFRPVSNLYFWILYKLGVSDIRQHYYASIVSFVLVVLLYWLLLSQLGLEPWLRFAGTLLLISDFHYYEVVSWPQAGCYLVSLFFGLLALHCFLKSLQGKRSYLWIGIGSLLWIFSVFAVEIGFSFLFMLVPLILLQPQRRQRFWSLGILASGVFIYLTVYLHYGHGAKSGAYLDPISSFSGYIERIRQFFPDYLIKKMTFDRTTYFDPLQPVGLYWLIFLGSVALAFFVYRKNNRDGYLGKPFSVLMLTTFLHPFVLVTTIVSSRSLSILGLTYHFFILSILAMSLRWQAKWRWLVWPCTFFLFLYGYRMVIEFTDRDPFFNETAICIQNLKAYEAEQLQQSESERYYSLNELPLAYHWNISALAKRRIEGQPFTDIRFEDLEISKLGPQTLQIRSLNPKGLIQYYQPYLFDEEFFKKDTFDDSGVKVTVQRRLISGIPTEIKVEFDRSLQEIKFVVWDQQCRWHMPLDQ